MTKSKQPDRARAISHAVKQWAFDEGKSYLISFWELADNISNQWDAPLFVSPNYKYKEHESGTRWAVPGWDLQVFRRQLPSSVRKMGAKIIKQGYNDFYRFPKKILQ